MPYPKIPAAPCRSPPSSCSPPRSGAPDGSQPTRSSPATRARPRPVGPVPADAGERQEVGSIRPTARTGRPLDDWRRTPVEPGLVAGRHAVRVRHERRRTRRPLDRRRRRRQPRTCCSTAHACAAARRPGLVTGRRRRYSRQADDQHARAVDGADDRVVLGPEAHDSEPVRGLRPGICEVQTGRGALLRGSTTATLSATTRRSTGHPTRSPSRGRRRRRRRSPDGEPIVYSALAAPTETSA